MKALLSYFPGAKKVKDSLHATISAFYWAKGAKGKAADYFAYGAD